MVNDLLCHAYDTLAAQGPDTQEIRLPLGRIIMRITPEKEKYRNLRQILKVQITAMESAELCRQQAAMAEYQRLAEEAWQNEQKRNDEESRKRAKEAAARDRERIAKSKETKEAEIASYKARYEKMKAEEASAKEAERKRAAETAAQRAQERAAKKISLETERRILQTELSNLKGLFSRKRRKQIEARISEINSELSTI
jgi:colicin import membrane protein